MKTYIMGCGRWVESWKSSQERMATSDQLRSQRGLRRWSGPSLNCASWSAIRPLKTRRLYPRKCPLDTLPCSVGQRESRRNELSAYSSLGPGCCDADNDIVNFVVSFRFVSFGQQFLLLVPVSSRINVELTFLRSMWLQGSHRVREYINF